MHERVSRLFSRIRGSDQPLKIDWLLFGILAALSFFLFSQNGDSTITFKHSMSLLDAISKGQFFHFYGYVYDIALKGGYDAPNVTSAAFYSVLLYLTLAIWNLPIWIIERCSGKLMNNTAVLLWDKLLIFALVLLSAYILYQIGLSCKIPAKKAKWMVYLFLTSPILLFGSVIFTQYDIFSLVTMLLAIHFLLRKRNLLFCVFIALSICYKNFAVLIFIPIVLLMEKRILHIIKYGAIGISLYALNSIVFSFDPGYRTTQSQLSNIYSFTKSLTENGFSTAFGPASFFGAAMVFLCVFAYKKRLDNYDDLPRYLIFFGLFAYGAFFCFVSWHPQWAILLVPFIVLMAVRSEDFRLVMFIDTALSVAYLFTSFYTTNNVDQNMVNNGILPLIFHFTYNNSTCLLDLLLRLHLTKTIINTLFVSTLASLVFLNAHELKYGVPAKVDDGFVPQRSVVWVRALSIFAFMLPTLALYFYQMHLLQ